MSDGHDQRAPIAKARDEYLRNKAALHGAPSGKYLRNRIEAAFCDGWNAGERNAAITARATVLEEAAQLAEAFLHNVPDEGGDELDKTGRYSNGTVLRIAAALRAKAKESR